MALGLKLLCWGRGVNSSVQATFKLQGSSSKCQFDWPQHQLYQNRAPFIINDDNRSIC